MKQKQGKTNKGTIQEFAEWKTSLLGIETESQEIKASKYPLMLH